MNLQVTREKLPTGTAEPQISGFFSKLLDNVTRTMLAEAKQPYTPAGLASVASVIRNRLAAGKFGSSPSAIVHAPNQFEPWNPGSGNDPRRFGADSPAYKQAQALAQGVFNGTVQDQTLGSTYLSHRAGKQRNTGRCQAGVIRLPRLTAINFSLLKVRLRLIRSQASAGHQRPRALLGQEPRRDLRAWGVALDNFRAVQRPRQALQPGFQASRRSRTSSPSFLTSKPQPRNGL